MPRGTRREDSVLLLETLQGPVRGRNGVDAPRVRPENRSPGPEAALDVVESEGQLRGDVLVRAHVPVQPLVRPRRDLRLLPRDAGLRYPRGRDRGHRHRRLDRCCHRGHAEGHDRGGLEARAVHRRAGLGRAAGQARAGLQRAARGPDGRAGAARRGDPGRRAGSDRGGRRRPTAQRARWGRDRLRDRGHRAVRRRDGRADPVRRHVPSGGLGSHDGRGEAFADQRVRHRVRGQDGAVEVRVLLGRVRPVIISAPDRVGLAPALVASRVRLWVVGLLFVLAGIGWWSTADRMRGMDEGPWTGLGALGWFLGAWVVMMAAMMFPSVAPTVALYARMSRGRTPLAAVIFAIGYLLTWTAAGVLAFAIASAGGRIVGDPLAWSHAGRWLARATPLPAGGSPVTPPQERCLGKCRSPLGFLLGSWREGPTGALRMGAKNGAWCVGCCWALMAALFALGIMSLLWMAVIAGLIAFEKTIPWRRVASYGTAAVLLGLGLLVLTIPRAIPGFTTPSNAPLEQMAPMNS